MFKICHVRLALFLSELMHRERRYLLSFDTKIVNHYLHGKIVENIVKKNQTFTLCRNIRPRTRSTTAMEMVAAT